MVSGPLLSLLTGVWSLTLITRTLHSKPIPELTFGQHPTGTILYHPTGFMSVLITATDAAYRPNFTLPKSIPPSSQDHEWALLAEHSWANSGPFNIDEEQKKVVHGPLMVSSLPGLLGAKLSRNLTIEEYKGQRYLTLEADFGEGVVESLKWKKIWRDVEFGNCIE